MLAKKPFQIKIALLGNTCAGKSTVLNALFRDKYTEVSMRRTTAVVNYFRVVPQSSTGVEEEQRNAASTLKEITNDNARFRDNSESGSVQEKWIDVELEEDLFDMREDTELVLVDIPGINEAGSCSKYQNYVNANWRKFDCVVLVLDGKQGVNTEDQVFLLNLAKKNLKEEKEIPLIILCNKIDDPDDEQQAELVDEARAAVEDIFEVDDASSSSPMFIPISALYAFIHQTASRMSMDTFQSFFDSDLIEKLGREQVGKRNWNRLSDDDKVREVYDIVSSKQEVLQESNFEAFLSALNRFAGGEDVQRSLIEKQFHVSITALQNQEFDFPNGPAALLTDQLRDILREAKVLYGADAQKSLPVCLSDFFFLLYRRYEDYCIDKLGLLGPLHVSVLVGPIEELLSFHKLCQQTNSDQVGLDNNESANILIRMKILVRRLIGVLLEQHAKFDGSAWMSTKKKDDGSPLSAWAKFSPLDWIKIWSSCLALSFDKNFCEMFGSEKALMEERLHDALELWSRFKSAGESSKLCPCCGNTYNIPKGFGDEQCDACKTVFLSPMTSTCLFCRAAGVSNDGLCMSNESQNSRCKLWRQLPRISMKSSSAVAYDSTTGRLQPLDSVHYSKIVHIEIPESFSNPSHIGHVAFMFCNFMETANVTSNGVLRHIFATILRQEPNSCIMKSLHYCGYNNIDEVFSMDKPSIDKLEYEGFDDKAKRSLDSEDKRLLLHFFKWVEHMKETMHGRDLTLMEWLSLTATDFQKYCKEAFGNERIAASTPQASNASHALSASTNPTVLTAPSAQVTPMWAHAPSFGSSQSGFGRKSYAGNPPREMLMAFYEDFNRNKIPDVDSLLVKYAGREEELFRKLATKYNVGASVFGFPEVSPFPFSTSPANSRKSSSFSQMLGASTFGKPVSGPSTGSLCGTESSSTPLAPDTMGTTAAPFGASPNATLQIATAPTGAPGSFGSTLSQQRFMSSAPFGTVYPSGSTAPPFTGGSAPVFTPGAAFGAQTTTSSFGSPVTSILTPSNPTNFGAGFGGTAPPPFGAPISPSFAGTRFGPFREVVGTKNVPFQPTNRQDGNQTITIQCISGMDAYKNKSFEELRFEDYNRAA